MRVTTPLARGFVGRSLDEFKRLSNIVLKQEGIKGATLPYELFSFHDADSIKDCKVMSDPDIGGFSTANLDWIPPEAQSSHPTPSSAASNGYARFHGNISTKLPQDRIDVQRSGYAAWRTRDRGPTIFGRSLWNIDPYLYIALRVKSDGRSYFVNLQTESVEYTDLHQHRLFSKRPGEWETILIKWNDFVRTNYGFLVEPQTELLRQKVRTIGIGLTDRVPGPFELCIERIWATNNRKGEEGDTEIVAKSELKDKSGQPINWDSIKS